MPEPGGTTARAREGLPLLRSEEEAVVVAVANEDLLELGSGVGVKDKGIDLIVATQGTLVEIGTAGIAPLAVNHHYLGVVKTAGIVIDLGSGFHEAVSLIVDNAGGDGDVALVTDHDLDIHTAPDGSLNGLYDGVAEGEIGVDKQYALLGIVEAMYEGTTNDLG